MQPDEYRRLSGARRAMAAQSSNNFTGEQVRWSILAQRSSDLADEVALTLAVERPNAKATLGSPSRLSASAAARYI
jgi:hypothetical protein